MSRKWTQQGRSRGRGAVDTGSSISLDPWVLAGLLGCAFLVGAMLGRPIARLAAGMRGAPAVDPGERPRNILVEQWRRSQEFAALGSKPGKARVHEAAPSPGGDIMLRAEIDSLAAIRHIAGEPARQAAIEQVAQVLRRSLRTGTSRAPVPADEVGIIPGEGFVIILRQPVKGSGDGAGGGAGKGAGEAAGAGIAQRLRSLLARTPIEGLGADIRLSASFGVAERASGERYAAWRSRAESALRTAKARGEGEIIEAQVAQEMILLPAPGNTASAAAHDTPITAAA